MPRPIRAECCGFFEQMAHVGLRIHLLYVACATCCETDGCPESSARGFYGRYTELRVVWMACELESAMRVAEKRFQDVQDYMSHFATGVTQTSAANSTKQSKGMK